MAAHDVDLRVDGGEVVGLIGANGAGKTTLLRLLSGSLLPDAGDARIGGFSIVRHPVAARRRLALVPDSPALFENLTVEEHLAFVAGVHRLEAPQDRIALVLSEMGLSSRRRDVASSLSRGLRQRLTLALAFVHEPASLLLDEPFLGLDPHGRRLLEDWIARRAGAGAAVLVSSHELILLERICHRFVFLREGRVLAEGTLEQLRSGRSGHEGLEDLFLEGAVEEA